MKRKILTKMYKMRGTWSYETKEEKLSLEI